MLPTASEGSSDSNESRDASDASSHRSVSLSDHGSEAGKGLDHNRGLGEPFEGDYASKAPIELSERWKWWKLYCLHVMFMWNHRTLEYASIILVALAFPKSLTATSIRGITSTLVSILCAPAIGSWIDKAPKRLRPQLLTIIVNNCSSLAMYLCWMSWPVPSDGTKPTDWSSSRIILFSIFLVLDVIRDLSSMANVLSMDRDWVPALVEPPEVESPYSLTHVNATMKRLDVICKLVAPSLLPLVVAAFSSRLGWIAMLAFSTFVNWIFQMWLAMVIAKENQQLLAPKQNVEGDNDIDDIPGGRFTSTSQIMTMSWAQGLHMTMFSKPSSRLKSYFSMQLWPASIAISLLQLTVLSYSATLITYLMEIGFALSTVTIARGSGTAMGLLSTFLTPWAVGFMRRKYARSSPGHRGKQSAAVRTVGSWAVTSNLIFMIPVVLVLWSMSSKTSNPASQGPPPFMVSMILFSFLSLTRIGHWSFELMIQELEQTEIPSSLRSTFAGTEQSFRELAALIHWGGTVIWNRPEDFGFLALGSIICLAGGTVIYVMWARYPGPDLADGRYEALPLSTLEED
ncbi:hypothetical protein BP5796_06132 [Coleophoma crateriformis]|uniref:Solute carrier family 40 member n=1 Tax=Coleophoma crateriformis TaxID=565419 RepID=A0A3D8RWH6_9HELO|nr:hypothetical protein BP5796_06132 [Coleophoma crateriformis]